MPQHLSWQHWHYSKTCTLSQRMRVRRIKSRLWIWCCCSWCWCWCWCWCCFCCCVVRCRLRCCSCWYSFGSVLSFSMQMTRRWWCCCCFYCCCYCRCVDVVVTHTPARVMLFRARACSRWRLCVFFYIIIKLQWSLFFFKHESFSHDLYNHQLKQTGPMSIPMAWLLLPRSYGAMSKMGNLSAFSVS